MDGKIQIWQVGNTGVRNPMRIQDALMVYAKSDLVGKLRSVEGASLLMSLLSAKGVLNNQAGKDSSGSYGRKWRLVFNQNGFTYPEVAVKYGFCKEDKQNDLGAIDHLTPFGEAFLKANTVPAVQECFLRSMIINMKKAKNGKYFSPLSWTLAVLLELEKKTGNTAVSFVEFATCIQTSDPSNNIMVVVDDILKIRKQKQKSTAKKVFDRKLYEKLGERYPKRAENFKEYGDMNLRYLRASGIIQRKGRGIAIVKEKHKLTITLTKKLLSEDSQLSRYQILCTGPKLPIDDINMAREILEDLIIQYKSRHLEIDISKYSMGSAIDINNARRSIEAKLSEANELIYAEQQASEWREISDYMSLIMKRGGTKEYDDDREMIKVPKEEVAAYLEWVIWRAILAIDHLKNAPYQVRSFRVDQDFMPVNTAPGNRPDLVAEFDDCVLIIEVTMSENSRQEAMEGEPVRRHLADAMQIYNKPVYGLFIARNVDVNTVETFRHGVWYTKNENKLDLHIVPFSLKQFKLFFEGIFKDNDEAKPTQLINLMSAFDMDRKLLDAPQWKHRIEETMIPYN
ncbi:AlwI family type II restriction endonuclease [Pectinatus frisingensis]|uniref:AlwI family type II restriction endonuclease n=1 Tax=Pectinatus frisingensis TaxID=865 RepID=UPI0018C83965|nr:AlwI family type II restriction endonuclease [Pectinatus frisingensis]